MLAVFKSVGMGLTNDGSLTHVLNEFKRIWIDTG